MTTLKFKSRVFIFLLFVSLLSTVFFAQSLGDSARQARQKEKSQPKTAKKVITNDEIPESPQASPTASAGESKNASSSVPAGTPAPKSAREWRRIIVAQMDDIENLLAQINKLKDSIHFVTANAYVNGAEYNRYQVRKQQEVKNLEHQLEERNKKLAETQEAAKKEGMGAAVYEP
jgi:cytoskeletal protein RodZ